MKKIIYTENAPNPIGPYVQANVFNGKLIFISGQIPIDPKKNEIVSDDIKLQTEQVLENLKAILIASNSSLENVLKTTVFIKNMNEFSVMNEIYSKYFTKDFPSRSTVEVSRLPKDVKIEIEAIAYTNF